MHDANEAGALEDLQVMSDGALREVELPCELLRRAGAVPQEADDASAQLVAEGAELLGVGDDERVFGGVLGEVTLVDDGGPYGKSRP